MARTSNTTFLLILTILVGCTVYPVHKFERPEVEIPEKYHHGTRAEKIVGKWWKEFDDPMLNRMIAQALLENLDILQAWRRLDQALALATIAGADSLPQANLQSGASRTRSVDRDAEDTRNRLFISSGLTYEIDIWRRIASQKKAARLRYEASREDLEETVLSLTGAIVDVWLTIREQAVLLELLSEQVATGKTLLELTELRFGLGKGSALDVFQQRQQLASIEAQIPQAKALLATAKNQLAVLLGRPPGNLGSIGPANGLPELPDLPNTGTPTNLYEMRPDLRAALKRLNAADHDVAVAVADRFPALSISLSYEFSARKLSDLFTEEIGTIAGDLIAPLLDGKRRRNEVLNRQAVVQELLHEFGQIYLEALLEVEDALILERHQLELIDRLRNQIGFAQSTLEESRSRYRNGLENYLTVLIAVQSLQQLQRQMISEKKILLAIRSQLYRALGGQWTKRLNYPVTAKSKNTDIAKKDKP